MEDALVKFTSQCSSKCSKFTLFSLLLQSLTDFLGDLETEAVITTPFSQLVSNPQSNPQEAAVSLQTLESLTSAMVKQNQKHQQLREAALALPLTNALSGQVNALDVRWTECQSILSSRQERIQDYCLRSADLSDKYKLWCDWLERVQPLLSPVHPSSEESLRSRQTKYQTVMAEMPCKCKVLKSIIKEGDQLSALESRPGQPRVQAAELQSQWTQLQETLKAKNDSVEETLQKWETFNTLRERLGHALSTLDSELQLVTLTKEAHLNMVDKIPALKSAFERHQQVARLMRQIGQRLLPDCDDKAQGKITSTTKSLHTQWQSVLSKLITQSEESSSLISTLRQLETAFASLNQELKSVRKELLTTLSEHHDSLQDQRAKCDLLDQKLEEISSRLALTKFDLAKVDGHIEDMSSLETRVSIYEGLLTETKGQIKRRQLLLNSRLSIWSDFMERVDALLADMQRLERCYLNDSHYTIEELLDKIASQYDSELIRMESRVDLLTAEGERLLPLSGEIYSCAIKHNCASLSTTIQRLNKLADTRTAKLRETLTAILEFESGMQALNSWLVNTERVLCSNELPEWRNETIADQHSSISLLENNIDHHGRVVTAVVNLCSVLQHDQDASQSQRDKQAVAAVRLILKDRWIYLIIYWYSILYIS